MHSGSSSSKAGAPVTSFAHSKLTALQDEVLGAFFQRERGFFLTWLLPAPEQASPEVRAPPEGPVVVDHI
jgi:hypothetical protein